MPLGGTVYSATRRQRNLLAVSALWGSPLFSETETRALETQRTRWGVFIACLPYYLKAVSSHFRGTQKQIQIKLWFLWVLLSRRSSLAHQRRQRSARGLFSSKPTAVFFGEFAATQIHVNNYKPTTSNTLSRRLCKNFSRILQRDIKQVKNP